MTRMSPSPTEPSSHCDRPGWSVAGLFIDAIAQRDFVALADCLDPAVRFRALVPRGVIAESDAPGTVSWFREWFGGGNAFEIEDASIGGLGSRVYLRWRVRMRSAGPEQRNVIVEQHAFAKATDRIVLLDLLCSGFHLESVPPDRAPPSNEGSQ
jgi:hypothetical protein